MRFVLRIFYIAKRTHSFVITSNLKLLDRSVWRYTNGRRQCRYATG